jgi:hypothetical protein
MKSNENTPVGIQLSECEWNGRQDRKNNNFSLVLQTFQKLKNCYVLLQSRVQSLGKFMWQLRQTQAEVFAIPPRCCCFCRRRLRDYHNYRGYNRKEADPSGCAV